MTARGSSSIAVPCRSCASAMCRRHVRARGRLRQHLRLALHRDRDRLRRAALRRARTVIRRCLVPPRPQRLRTSRIRQRMYTPRRRRSTTDIRTGTPRASRKLRLRRTARSFLLRTPPVRRRRVAATVHCGGRCCQCSRSAAARGCISLRGGAGGISSRPFVDRRPQAAGRRGRDERKSGRARGPGPETRAL